MATKKMETPDVVREGTKLVLPAGMSYDSAMEYLTHLRDQEARIVAVVEQCKAFPWEGALALATVAKSRYGALKWHRSTTINVPVSPTASETVRWGTFSLPNVPGNYEMASGLEHGIPTFSIRGQCVARDRHEVAAFMDAVRAHLKSHSVYQGKAIRVAFPEEGNPFDVMEPPTFIDLAHVDRRQLILPHETALDLDYSLFTPLEQVEEARALGIPLKRGVLCAGPFGTGKTLAAMIAARIATDNGWTVLYLDHVTDLGQAIMFARRFQPCLIFAEDIDLADGERTITAIRNNLDGVDSKADAIMVLLTTNYLDRLPQSLLRPGRLDAVVRFTPPDMGAASQLLRHYGRGLIPASENLVTVAGKVAGMIPAVIREVVERAKLAALTLRGPGKGVPRDLILTSRALDIAANRMLAHAALLTPKPVDNRGDIERAADRLASALERAALLADARDGNGYAHPARKALRLAMAGQLALPMGNGEPTPEPGKPAGKPGNGMVRP